MITKYCLGFILIILLASLSPSYEAFPPSGRPVAKVLEQLGDTPSAHFPDYMIKGVSAETGLELVFYGRAKAPDGSRSPRISNHFVCISCHNVERDEPNFKTANPELRLKYAVSNGLPYLQGSSFYGIVNRTSFYNGDYEKKYGDLVKLARNNLREAIQLCATECSQGRLLKDWELESILAYFWTIGLTMNDLRLTPEDSIQIEAALKGLEDKSYALNKLKTYYLQGIPATFMLPPEDRKASHTSETKLQTGKLLYELSCLHCHAEKKYSFFALDNSTMTFEFLAKHFSTYSRYSGYQVVRHGTSPVPWKRAYMPNYTKEKMSDEMLESLRAYIYHMAKTQ